jgi:hypothetical protein
MAEENILDLLERRVYQALKKIAEQQKSINSLIREKQELEQILNEKEREISELRLDLEQVSQQSESGVLKEFQEREYKLKERIQELVDKIDKVRLLE